MLKKAITLCLCLGIASTSYAAVKDFTQAIRTMPVIYEDLRADYPITSFYCNCPIVLLSSGRFSVDLQSCGYKPRTSYAKAARTQYTHIVPTNIYAANLKCYQEGGSNACRYDNAFNQRDADMHNIMPVIEELDKDRADFKFTNKLPKSNQYGQCDMTIDFEQKLVSPPEATRGQIARIYLYMSKSYGFKLKKQEFEQFKLWDKLYPPNFKECQRNLLVTKYQGNDNPFVTRKCR